MLGFRRKIGEFFKKILVEATGDFTTQVNNNPWKMLPVNKGYLFRKIIRSYILGQKLTYEIFYFRHTLGHPVGFMLAHCPYIVIPFSYYLAYFPSLQVVRDCRRWGVQTDRGYFYAPFPHIGSKIVFRRVGAIPLG